MAHSGRVYGSTLGVCKRTILMSTPRERLQILARFKPQQANASPNLDTWTRDFVLEKAPMIPDRAEGTSADTWTRNALEAD
jgi:hypothetical protein